MPTTQFTYSEEDGTPHRYKRNRNHPQTDGTERG